MEKITFGGIVYPPKFLTIGELSGIVKAIHFSVSSDQIQWCLGMK